MVFGSFRKQLRSVIEWENADSATLFSLWSENGDEIKDASKLLVKPGQGAVFLYEGKVQAVHTTPGLYELKTANIPFVTTLLKIMQSFESEHKVGIYFFWTTELLNQKWGTPAPVKYLDPVYKFPVGLRAFGNFSFKIASPENFFVNIVGARSVFSVDDARLAITQRFTQPLTDSLPEAGYAFIEVDKHRDELAATLTGKVSADCARLGFQLTDFRIENTDFDADTVARVNTIANTIADAEAAKAAGLNYAQLQ